MIELLFLALGLAIGIVFSYLAQQHPLVLSVPQSFSEEQMAVVRLKFKAAWAGARRGEPFILREPMRISRVVNGWFVLCLVAAFSLGVIVAIGVSLQ
jgi:hypothetical protein